jgi:hypothetical protein
MGDWVKRLKCGCHPQVGRPEWTPKPLPLAPMEYLSHKPQTTIEKLSRACFSHILAKPMSLVETFTYWQLYRISLSFRLCILHFSYLGIIAQSWKPSTKLKYYICLDDSSTPELWNTHDQGVSIAVEDGPGAGSTVEFDQAVCQNRCSIVSRSC